MNILWVCNIEIPVISDMVSGKRHYFGGWLDDMSRRLLKDHSLTVAYMGNENGFGQEGNLKYFCFREEDATETFRKILSDNSYDLIHIWGTEYRHSLDIVQLLKASNSIDKCVVSIQGLAFACARHYTDGLPLNIVYGKGVADWILFSSVNKRRKQFEARSRYEKELISSVKNVIGRTDWDRACVTAINPNIQYYKCNESLRDSFYSAEWDYDKCDKHTIFVSQCSYPIKGFHYLLQAMPVILNRYPDARIVVTGRDVADSSFGNLIRNSRYDTYLKTLILTNGLKDKVIFKGALSENEMLEEYLKANVFVSPSTIENSSNSIGEAMLVGCPVIASYVGGTPSTVKDGDEGFLYQAGSTEMLANRIIRVFDAKEQINDICERARQTALKRHDREKNYASLMEIYSSIVE